METLSKYIQNVNEARQIDYRVALMDVQDEEGLPISVDILVDKEYQKQFEKWLEDEQDNIFSHAEGGRVEY
jgi:hypothetical protein